MPYPAGARYPQDLREGVLSGDGPERLARRFQRASFALATVLLALVGTVTLTHQIWNLRARTLESDNTTLQVLRSDLVNHLDGIADEMLFLSQSPLVWTAISDSAGRDAYLRPSLRADSARNRTTRLTLLDYRGRLIAGASKPLDPGADPDLAELLARALQGQQPLGQVSRSGARLLLAFPVLYPYGGYVIGVLMAEVGLVELVRDRALSLDGTVGLALGLNGRELLVFPPRAEARNLTRTTPLVSRNTPGLYAFELSLFHRQPIWIGPLMNLVLVYLTVAGLVVAFTWRAAHYLAEGLTGRLGRLAKAVAAGGGPENLPEDPSRDEIGTLTRVLRESLRVNRELTQDLEARVAERTHQLTEREAQYRFLAENIKDVVWTLDADSLRYLYVSPSIRGLRGYTPEELQALPADAGLSPDAARTTRTAIARQAAACRAGQLLPGSFQTHQLEQACKGGGRVWTEEITSYRLDERRGRVIVLGVTRDISARRRTEEMQRFSAFQAGVAEMSVSVLHNIGNAVTAVLSDAASVRKASEDLRRIAYLLKRHETTLAGHLGEPGPDAAAATNSLAVEQQAATAIDALARRELDERCQRIEEGVQHIAEIVRIQQNAALPTPSDDLFDVGQAVRDVLTLQGESLDKHRIAVVVELAPGLAPVRLSRNRLLQALMNAIKNSKEAIAERQSREPDLAGQVRIRVETAPNGCFQIEVSDNGIGLNPEGIPHLFRFGYSTKQRGSGFGLHSIALFSQEMAGRVTLEPAEDTGGARLRLVLPVTPPPGSTGATPWQHEAEGRLS